MSLLLILIGIVVLPGVIMSAVKIGEFVFSAATFILGGILFLAVLSFGTCAVLEAVAPSPPIHRGH